MRRVVVWIAVAAAVAMLSGCVPPRVGVTVPGAPGGSDRGAPTPGRTDGSDPAGLEVVETTRCDQPDAGDAMQRVVPDEVALDTAAVEDAVTYGSARGAQSLRIYRHGCLVATSGWDPSTERTPLPSWSMTKGMVSLITGRAVTMGHLGVDDPIGLHLEGLSPAHAAITVRHLLTQTSGLRFAWANDLNAAAKLDSAAVTLARPFEAEPGTTWVYAQTAVTALVAVVEAAVGEDFQSFAARELFEPIGIARSDWRWARDSAGRSQGFAWLDMAPHAFGRIGALLLAEGSWRGQTLVDPDYIRQAHTGGELNPAYGFLWWSNESERIITAGFPAQQDLARRWLPTAPPDAFGMSGLFDQILVVIPSLDMVVVRMGLPNELFGDPMGEIKMQRPRWDHRFFQLLLAGVQDQLFVDVGDWAPDPRNDQPDLFHLFGVGF